MGIGLVEQKREAKRRSQWYESVKHMNESASLQFGVGHRQLEKPANQ
jgi:hypothetical protein